MKYATTDKLNDSMKAKVFKYKSDGNTVVAPYMELEPYAENVYLSLSRKNEYGNEDDDCFHVVCRIENVYFSSGQYSRRFLNGENRREEAAAYCRNWITDTLQGAERGAFVKLISVRVFEALGLDTAPLMQAREAYKRKQEQKRREREEKEAEERGKSNISCCSMNRNRNSWTGNGSREECSLKSPEGMVLTSISEPKGHSTGM